VVGLGPERGGGGGIGHRQAERHAAVGQRHRAQPVAQLAGAGVDGRGHVLEHLEGVERTTRLALGGPEVRLQAPAVAAVGIAVALQRAQRARAGLAVEEDLRAAAVEHAGMGDEELPRRGHVDIGSGGGHAPMVSRRADGVLNVPAMPWGHA
jgi:hypothetical protein